MIPNTKPKKKDKNNNNQPKNKDKKKNKNKNQPFVRAPSNGNNAPTVSSPVDLGDQLSSVVKNGYGATLRMYPSCVDFARVYADPFSIESARIPHLPLLPSKLVRFTGQGSTVVSSSGYVWLAIQPEAMVSNFNSTVYFSTASGGPSFFSGIDGTNYSGITTNSSYPLSAFYYGNQNSLMLRVVASGLRMRYQGTVLNASGDWYAVQTDPRQNIAGIDTSAIQKFPGNKTGAFNNGGWKAHVRHITSNTDFNYLQFNSTTNTWVDAITGTDINGVENCYMGIIASAIAGQPIEFETVVHAELVGPNLDYTGLGQVHHEDTHQVISSFTKLRQKDRLTIDNTTDRKSVV